MPRKGDLRTDLSGRRFGRVTVVRFDHRSAHRRSMWLCRCDCGTELVAMDSNLKGKTASCGCLRREVLSGLYTTHGHSKHAGTPEYESWCAMRARIAARSGARWRNYGSRGITACARWESFENFLADMGPRPPGTSLDRINNDGNYEPGNCRWATAQQQNSNKRSPTRLSREERVP